MRALLPILLVLTLACEDGEPATPPSGASAAASASGAPALEPAPGETAEAPPTAAPEPATQSGADCLSLCQRTALCMEEQGRQPDTPHAECEAACNPGGSFSRMPPASFECATRPDCTSFLRCTTHVIVDMALRKSRGGT